MIGSKLRKVGRGNLVNQMELPLHEAKQKQWNPYENHGGTSIGILGKDYVLIASDTRLAANYSIDSRDQSRIFKMTSRAIICATGFSGDVDSFISRLRFIISHYENEHFKEMSTRALAEVVQNVLYSKRFFPFYISVFVAGVDSEGKGQLFSYDPIGTIELVDYDAHGTGLPLAAPILDSAFGRIHRNTVEREYPSIDFAKSVARDAMCSVTERDVYTGDKVEIAVISAEGLKIESYSLPSH